MQRTRMSAAADALAMGVEQDDLDILEAVLDHGFAELQPQPLDEIGRRDLPDIAAGIGIAELDAELAGAAQIGPVMRAAQRFLDDAATLAERLRRLEERADLDLVLDPEQLGEVERA